MEAKDFCDRKRLEIFLLESLNSGIATPLTEQDWDNIRQVVWLRIQEHK